MASICQHPNLKRGESNLGEDGYQTAELWDFTLSLYQIQLPVSAALPAFPHIVIFTWFFHCSVISKWLGWNASKCLDDVILNNASSLHRRWPSNDGQDKEAYQPEQITRQPIKICSLYHTICIHYRYQKVSEMNEIGKRRSPLTRRKRVFWNVSRWDINWEKQCGNLFCRQHTFVKKESVHQYQCGGH